MPRRPSEAAYATVTASAVFGSLDDLLGLCFFAKTIDHGTDVHGILCNRLRRNHPIGCGQSCVFLYEPLRVALL